MRWKTFKAQVKKKPHLLDPAFQCSLEEAGSLLAVEGYPSFREMAAGARRKSDLPDTLWAEVDTFFERRKAKKRQSISAYAALRPRQFRLAVVSLILLVIVGYFTVTPTGRALAKQLFDMVFVWTEGSPEIVNQDNPDNRFEQPITDDVEMSFSSYAELEEATGYTPARFRVDWLHFKGIEYVKSGKYPGVRIWCNYETLDGRYVVILQQWGELPSSIILSNDDDPSIERFGTEYDWYCWRDNVDGAFDATAILENSILDVSLEKDVDPEAVMAALEIRQ